MARTERKYNTPTTHVNLRIETKDLDTLKRHSTFKDSVTDLIQRAIKNFIILLEKTDKK